MDKIEQLEVLLSEARVEATKFYEKGNNSAGSRLRQKMQAIKVICQEVRVDVSEIKKDS